MNSKFITFLLIGIVAIAGGFLFLQRDKPGLPSGVNTETGSDELRSQDIEVISGNVSKFYEFDRNKYDDALASNRIIFLNFYANWCPICRVEAPELDAGFNELNLDTVVGFRVNFNDDQTSEEEKQLAKEFRVSYQHTKIIVKNGSEFSRSMDQWTKEDFLNEINKALR